MRVSDLLELKSQTILIVSHHVGTGNQTQVLWKIIYPLTLSIEPFASPTVLFFF